MAISLSTPRHGLARLLASAYLLLLAYGSLFPLRDWRPPESSVASILMRMPANPPPTDIATNLLVYAPAGILLVFALPGARVARSIVAVMICALLSLTLESLQAWLPARDTSGLDVMLNTTGALLGTLAAPVIAATLRPPISLPGYAHLLRHEPATRAGLAALALWFGSHWAPFVPSLDPWRQVWQSVKPVWITIRDGGFDPYIAVAYALEALAIGVILTGLLRTPNAASFWLMAVMVVLLAGKPLMIGRDLSAELLAGFVIAFFLFVLRPARFTPRHAALAAAALLSAWAMHTLGGTFSATPQESFNWIPLRHHLRSPINGIIDLAATASPAAVLAYLALRSGARHRALVAGAVAVVTFAGALEWLQRWQPESYPDVTDMLVPGAAWVITFVAGARPRHPADRPGKDP